MNTPEITAKLTAEPTDDGRVAVTLTLTLENADLLHQFIDDAVIAAEGRQR